MKTGILTFAFNTKYDYLLMAKNVAARADKFLNLPTSVVVDQDTLDSSGHTTKEFDHVIVVDKPQQNSKHREPWFNKNRWNAFDLSPYEDTLVLDSDYVINSDRIKSYFSPYTDFGCFRRARYICSNSEHERLSPTSFKTYWATGIRFVRTVRTEQIFRQIEIVQQNYEYYSELYGFLPYSYRNDYALTIALRTVNGQLERPQDFFIGDLINIDATTTVTKVSDTEYKFIKEMNINGNTKKVYIQVSDFDFHLLNKNVYMGLINE